MTDFDIAIIGGGPAGATLARLLDSSLRVIFIDGKTNEENSFRKTCGGLLSPDAQKAFAEFDLTLPKEVLVDPQIFSVRTIDLPKRMERHYQRFYVNLDRHKFDLWLESLIPVSVERFVGKCFKVEKNGDKFLAYCRGNNGEEAAFSCRFIVGADGAGSVVRRFLYPKKKIRRYMAIQQWFHEKNPNPFYSCIFDPKTSDCCSWTISKDSYFIYGGAFTIEHCREQFELQKRRLSDYGLRFGEPLRTEACQVLRPKSPLDICSGRGGAFLIGEAAGLISPSSLEGISFAVNSARKLAETLNSGLENANRRYARRLIPMRIKIMQKVMKTPFMYNPFLRRIVMKSGLSTIKITPNVHNFSLNEQKEKTNGNNT